MGLWEFFSLSHFLIVFFLDYGTVGLWDEFVLRATTNKHASQTPYFSVFRFHISLKKASQTPHLSVFTFHLSLFTINRTLSS